MSATITVDGIVYTQVERRRPERALDSDVYRSENSYLRIGAPDVIGRTIRIHREMESAGFPVARMLSEGVQGGRRYFIEESLGDVTFRLLFTRETETTGKVSDKTFDAFADVAKKFLHAQAKARTPSDARGFAAGIHLDVLAEELPQYRLSLPMRFERILQRLEIFPFVLSHGDLGPANMYPRGVIDLEDSFPAPFGFDAISALTTIDWFPDGSEYEFPAKFRFTSDQRHRYLTMIDEVAVREVLPALSPYLGDLDFFRAVWLCARMGEWPNIQKWRYDRFIREYLLM